MKTKRRLMGNEFIDYLHAEIHNIDTIFDGPCFNNKYKKKFRVKILYNSKLDQYSIGKFVGDSNYDCLPEFKGWLGYEKDMVTTKILDSSASLRAELLDQLKEVYLAKLNHDDNRGLYRYYISLGKEEPQEWYLVDVAIFHNMSHWLNGLVIGRNMELLSIKINEIDDNLLSDRASEKELSLMTKDEIDDRIPLTMTKEELENYFMKLNGKNHNKETILSEADIKHFLHANFQDYSPKLKPKKIYPKTTKGALNRFIYVFYFENYKYQLPVGQEVFIRLLQVNFLDFYKNDPKKLLKYFSKPAPSSYPF